MSFYGNLIGRKNSTSRLQWNNQKYTLHVFKWRVWLIIFFKLRFWCGGCLRVCIMAQLRYAKCTVGAYTTTRDLSWKNHNKIFKKSKFIILDLLIAPFRQAFFSHTIRYYRNWPGNFSSHSQKFGNNGTHLIGGLLGKKSTPSLILLQVQKKSKR